MNPNANEWDPSNPYGQRATGQGYFPQTQTQGAYYPHNVMPQVPNYQGMQAQPQPPPPHMLYQQQPAHGYPPTGGGQGYFPHQQQPQYMQHAQAQAHAQMQAHAIAMQMQARRRAQQEDEERERQRQAQADLARRRREEQREQERQQALAQRRVYNDHSDDDEPAANAKRGAPGVGAGSGPQGESAAAGGSAAQGGQAAGKKKKRKRGRRKKKQENADLDSQSMSQSQSQSVPATPSATASQAAVSPREEEPAPQESVEDSVVEGLAEGVANLDVTEEPKEPEPEPQPEGVSGKTPVTLKVEKQSSAEGRPAGKNGKKSKKSDKEGIVSPREGDKGGKPGKRKKSEASDVSSNRSKSSKATKTKKKGKKKPVHDSREHVNLVFIGHVDAGKSTMSGQILLQTGQIDERTIAKYEREARDRNRESWWIAYIMDQDEEEKAKGKTVECGRAHFDTPTKRYTILDAPGHKNYVPNMISGASQADIAILVVSARRGEFEAGFDRGGQTREHSILALTLGINRVVVVVNKMDSCRWSHERYDDIVQKIKDYLKEIGFKEKNMSFLPIAGQNGENLKDKVPSKVCPWYKGKSMLDTLDELQKLKRQARKPLRVPVIDRYKGEHGLTAIGKVEFGGVSVGDTVLVQPVGRTAVVSRLEIDDQVVENASAGENVVMSFDSRSQVNFDQIHGGSVITQTTDSCPVTKSFTAQIYLSEMPDSAIMTRGYRSVLHVHNVTTNCEIIDIPHKVQPKTMRRSKRPPTVLRNKDMAIVKIGTKEAIAIEAFSDFQQLGRFALRDKQRTIGIGKIESIDDEKCDKN